MTLQAVPEKNPQNEELYLEMCEQLLVASNHISAVRYRTLKSIQLSDPQYHVLRILRQCHPRDVSVKYIGDYMIKPMSNTSRIIDKLVAKNLVTRIRYNQDRRQVRVKLTAMGADVESEATLQIRSALSHSMHHLLGKEAELLKALLNKIVNQNED